MEVEVENLVKQRFVGILVILSVGIILWPLIFAPHEKVERLPSLKVPPVPEIKEPTKIVLDLQKVASEVSKLDFANSEVKQLDDLEDAEPILQKEHVRFELGESSLGRTRVTSPEKPKLDSSGIPIAYILQVASMANRERAIKIRDELIKLNHKAYLREVKLDEVIRYRVYVGPKFEQTKLESIQPVIDETFAVNSRILRYYP